MLNISYRLLQDRTILSFAHAHQIKSNPPSAHYLLFIFSDERLIEVDYTVKINKADQTQLLVYFRVATHMYYVVNVGSNTYINAVHIDFVPPPHTHTL